MVSAGRPLLLLHLLGDTEMMNVDEVDAAAAALVLSACEAGVVGCVFDMVFFYGFFPVSHQFPMVFLFSATSCGPHFHPVGQPCAAQLAPVGGRFPRRGGRGNAAWLISCTLGKFVVNSG